MAQPQIEVEGLSEVRKAFKKFSGDEGKKLLKEEHKSIAQIVADAAASRAPRRSGKLAESVRATGGVNYGSAKAGKKSAPWGVPVHWGWPSHWPSYQPQPFMYEAFDSRRDAVIERAETLVAKLAGLVSDG